MQNETTTLTYTGNGERIDTRLRTQFPYSRNFFHHIISRGGILLGTKPIKKSYKLKHNDIISIDNIQRYLDGAVLDEAPAINIPILKETDDYLVINKPKGVLSHPNSIWDVGQPSVVGFLYHRYKNLPSIGNFIRAGLLHRLDKGTDGLMLIAKTEQGLHHFKHLFQQKSGAATREEKESVGLHKYYRAIAVLTDTGREFLETIQTFPYYIEQTVIAKVPHSVPKMGITKILSVTPVSFANKACVQLDIEILTGRTHQIRYHLSQHGLPIVGDTLYGTAEKAVDIQLTAYKLSFIDLDTKTQNISL